MSVNYGYGFWWCFWRVLLFVVCVAAWFAAMALVLTPWSVDGGGR